MYRFIRPLLFKIDPERAHSLTISLLRMVGAVSPLRYMLRQYYRASYKPVHVFGLEFPNPVGLAAGYDKDGSAWKGAAMLGFGHIELGTVTLRPQPGNPKPRVFRFPAERAIINRMGFTNKGVDYLLNNISQLPTHDYILGINIGKNLSTPVENALSDYTLALQQVYTSADYITINISSPNTPGLRNLQSEEALETLLKGIDDSRKKLQDEHQVNRPIALKVAPDLDDQAIAPICDLLIKHNIDALIATNTTLDKSKVKGHPAANEAGGLSGAALTEKSRQILYKFHQQLQDEVPIISAGGIDCPKEAQLRLDLGAKLIQIYSAIIFEGPGIINKIAKSIRP